MSAGPTVQPPGALVLAVLAGAAHLGVGWVYLAGGLVVPAPVLVLLWLVWVVLAVWLIRLAGRRSWWTPAVPVVAAAVFVLTVVIGGGLLGWTA